jgi:RNA polymerase sigma-70 factor (ECF subfamily)
MEPSDIELMLRAREGDLAAFTTLVGRYREPLRRFFAAMIADRSRAEDLVQETFLRLWLCRERYEPTGRFSTYLFQVGKHQWWNQRKKWGRELSEQEVDGALIVEPLCETQPEAVLLRRLRAARVREAVAALPEPYRVVFELAHLQELRYAEISERLGIPVGTVKSRVFAAVRRLRQSLAEPEEE